MIVRYQLLGYPGPVVAAERPGPWVPPIGTPVVLAEGPTPGDYVVHTVVDRPDAAVPHVVVWLVPA